MRTQAERDCIMNDFTQATIQAEHDEMGAALELAAEAVTDACAYTSAITYTPSDQGDWLDVREIECAVHEPNTCPAESLTEALYASNLYTNHIDWLTTEYPVTARAISRHETLWRFNLVTYRDRAAA